MKPRYISGLLLAGFLFCCSCSIDEVEVNVKQPPQSPSMCSCLAKNMFNSRSSSKIIITTAKVDTTSTNYHISRKWDRDCMHVANHSCLE